MAVANVGANVVGGNPDVVNSVAGPPPVPSVIQVGDTGTASVASGAAGSPLPGSVTAGNTVILNVGVISATGQSTTVTSNRGTPILVIRQAAAGGGQNDLEQWYLPVTSTGALTVTVTTSDATNWRCQAVEASNCPNVSLAGQFAGSAQTTPTCPCGTTGKTNQLLVAAMNSSSVPTAGPGAPWTVYNAGGWTFANRWSSAYQVFAPGTGTTAQWSQPSGAVVMSAVFANT